MSKPQNSKVVTKSHAAKPKNNSRSTGVYAPVAYAEKQIFPMGQTKSRRIQNSELVGSISGSANFTVQSQISLNPGLPSSFPWLSEIASKWQQFRFHKLHFRFVTRSPTSAKGSIILSPDYNPRELVPTTESQATNTQDAVEDVVWRELCCKLDVAAMFPLGPRKQIRVSKVAGDTSVYDAGRMFICTVGEADSSEIGKLWVDYDVELFVPQNSPNTYTGPLATSLFECGSSQSYTNNTEATLLFTNTIFDGLNLGLPSSGVFTLPAGCYRLRAIITCSDSAAETFAVTALVQKNGVTLDGGENFIRTAGVASNLNTLCIQTIGTFSGTDELRVRLTLVGATGTLLASTVSSLMIELA